MDFAKDFLGYNFVWFIGEVEERNDPLKLGRVKVRCFGWHTTDKAVLPTENLPWASTVQPVTNPAASSTGLTVGVWVFGFFMDGQRAQKPIVMGHIPGYRFGSPGQSEIPAAARAEEDYPSPITEVRAENITEEVAVDKDAATTWNEPEEPEDVTYPETATVAHESGFIVQTTGEGRHTLFSPSGSYEEMMVDGTRISKVQKDNYKIVAGDDYVEITGTVNLTVNGNVNWNIAGDWTMNVGGNVTQTIGGNEDVSIEGNITHTVSGNEDVSIQGNITHIVGGSEEVSVEGNITHFYSGNVNERIGGNVQETVGGNVTNSTGGSKTDSTGGAVTITGATIDLN